MRKAIRRTRTCGWSKSPPGRFRSDGIDGVGVASLMADAGLTHGGFYAHFASKEALVKEALIAALASSSALPQDEAEAAAPLDLRAYIDFYFSPAHRDKAATGCALAALAPEIARRPRATRNAFGKAAGRLAERIAVGVARGGCARRKARRRLWPVRADDGLAAAGAARSRQEFLGSASGGRTRQRPAVSPVSMARRRKAPKARSQKALALTAALPWRHRLERVEMDPRSPFTARPRPGLRRQCREGDHAVA